MLIDRWGRLLERLDISVTRRCNLSCAYCHRSASMKSSEREGELTSREIGRIARIARELGVRNASISGGEPLVRGDICKVISAVKRAGMKEISLTTNGTHLGRLSRSLKKAGLSRVEVTIDYPALARFGKHISMVRRGLENAREAGLSPDSLEMTVMKGRNEGDVWRMFELAKSNGATLKLRELSRCASSEFRENNHEPLASIEPELLSRSETVFDHAAHGKKDYHVKGAQIELSRPEHHEESCKRCATIRISSEGKLVPCAMRPEKGIDFIGAMRKGADDDELKRLFLLAVDKRELRER